VRWPWRRPAPDTSEAQDHLDQLARQQPEVDRLTADLQRAQERNHFSEAITAAFARRREV